MALIVAAATPRSLGNPLFRPVCRCPPSYAAADGSLLACSTARPGEPTGSRRTVSRGSSTCTIGPIASPVPSPPGDAGEGKLDLTVAALPAPPGTAAAFAAALEDLPGYLSGSGYHPLGLEVLRKAIALRFNERGVPTFPRTPRISRSNAAGGARGTCQANLSGEHPEVAAMVRAVNGVVAEHVLSES